MTAAPDSRVVRITRWLLDQDLPRSTSVLAADIGMSERVVRYRLPAVENYLRGHDASLVRQRGTGLWIVADDAKRAEILADLDSHLMAPRVYGPIDREHLLLDLLLWSYPTIVPLDQLNDALEVSKTSARRDLRRCEPWLNRMNLPVLRRPGQGIELVGSEQRTRRAILQLMLECVPPDVLDELVTTDFASAKLVSVRVPAGLRDRLSSLSLLECARSVEESALGPLLSNGNNRLVFTLYVAITTTRAEMGRPIDLEAGHLQSLLDHPASDNIRALAETLPGAAVRPLPDEEIAGLTDYLLGIDALSTVEPESTDNAPLLRSILDIASERLHESLNADDELRRSLSFHLSRLRVRVKYNLPVHNPLLIEVKERYPDVHAVSEDLADVVGDAMGVPINADEIGFITMYLSGAMERANLRPRRQALVVCPSGMATAWVLVSRLQAEFPELSLAEVASAGDYESRDTAQFDVVISTIDLDNAVAPVVVVSPLLSSADVERLKELLNS